MSQSAFSKYLFILLLFFCLAISGALDTEVMAAEKLPAPPPPDVKTSTTAVKTTSAVNKTPVTLSSSAIKTAAVSKTVATTKPGLITDIRWANHVDAVTGIETIRIVLDTSSPVRVQDIAVDDPSPQLIITIKGAKPDNMENIVFDGNIIKKASFSLEGKNDSKITFDLPDNITKEEYKVFTLKKGIEPGKPFRVVIDIAKPAPLPEFAFTKGLKNKVIVIDPGHGGSDSGAIGPSKIMEKNVTLAVAQLVKELLEKENANVIMTRANDRDVFGVRSSDADELGARVSAANKNKADIFISIHANAFTKKEVGGTSTYYYQKTIYDLMLANSLQKSLLQSGKLQDRRANASNFYVVKRTYMPAALIELAFISNPNEERLLNSPDFQKKMANGIVDGVKNFFEQAAKLRGEE